MSDNAQQLYMGCLDVSRGLRNGNPAFTEQHSLFQVVSFPASEEKFAVLIFREFCKKAPPRSALCGHIAHIYI
ncbi:MAG: hypothetical protein AB1342_08420 [Pseudomonadota bacterium]